MEVTKYKGITTIVQGNCTITIYSTSELPIELEPVSFLTYLSSSEAEDLAAALLEAARIAREGEG